MVAPQGLLALALYRRTLMCSLWKLEKRWYAAASTQAQRRARDIYTGLFRAAFFLTKRDFESYVASYQSVRGMNFAHNLHDWMGGYPYESVLAAEVDALMQKHGFVPMHDSVTPMRIGFFGSGCVEYLYHRPG